MERAKLQSALGQESVQSRFMKRQNAVSLRCQTVVLDRTDLLT
jgi:hypothetical protein